MVIGKYIYGIIPRPRPSFRLRTSMDDSEQSEESRSGQVNSDNRESRGSYGITACREVHFIPYQDIAAVVIDSQVVDYTHMFKDALARLLVEHQKMIEEIMSLQYSVIPMRLGTFAEDEEEVRHMLAKGYPLIENIFNKIKDLIEIDMVATWSDFTSLIKEVGEDSQIKELKDELLGNSKGITVDDQMKVGFMIKKALDEKREKLALKIHDTLKTVSVDSKTHEVMDDKMVVNLAFLIDKAKLNEFYAKIEDLNIEFTEKLNFRCVGPLPPYSFYTLEIKKMQFNEVDWARKKLGIFNDSITKNEIKKAYQKQAFTFHPDKNPGQPGIEKEFDEIKKSYQILLDYAYSCEQSGQASLIFNEDEFKKNALLVKLRD